MGNRLPVSETEDKIRQFLRGDLPAVEFEQWVYNTPSLQSLCGRDLYLELLSVDYRDVQAVESMKRRLIVWFNDKYPRSIPEMDKDPERRTIRISGHEIAGSLLEMKCEKCNSFLVHHDIYDSNFCPLGMNSLLDQSLFTTDRMRQSTDLCVRPLVPIWKR